MKEFQLQPGALIIFDGVGENSASRIAGHGRVGIVVKHWQPIFLDVLVDGKIIELNFGGAIPLDGRTLDFTLLAGPSNTGSDCGKKRWSRRN